MNKDNNNKNNNKNKNNKNNKSTNKNSVKTPIKVFCVSLNKEFDSIRSAAKYLNIDPSGISKVINGKQKTAGGYLWSAVSPEKRISKYMTNNEYRYWLNRFIQESKYNSLEELENDLKYLCFQIQNL